MPGTGAGAMNIPRWAQQWRLPEHGGIQQQVCAVALAGTGTFALVSLIPFLAAGRPNTASFPLNVLYAPAWFLFDSFLWFSLLIPALCYVYVIVLYNDRVTREMMASLVAVGLFLPVLGTLSHVLLGEAGAFAAVALVAAFGRVPAAILLILILMLESVAFFALLKRWREQAWRTAAEAPPHDALALAAPEESPAGDTVAVPPAYANAAAPYANGAGHYANGSAPPQSNGAGHAGEPDFAANGAAPADPMADQPAPAHEAASDHPDSLLAAALRAEPSQAAELPARDDGAAEAETAAALPDHASQDHASQDHASQDHASQDHASQDHASQDRDGADDDGEMPAALLEPPAQGEQPAPPTTGSSPAAATVPGRAGRSRRRGYHVPVEVLDIHKSDEPGQVENDTREAAATLMTTLAEFRIDAEVTGVRRGPVITMFEILPAPGVKISRIVNLADNIALRLAASRVRIVAPIPGKHAVGIEVPNRHRAIVGFRDLISLKDFRPAPRSLADGIPIALGKDITGEAQVIDLTATPHLLIAGATGAGKSVLVNALICSILYSRTPEQVRLLLIDPKIVELKLYNDVPHLLTPVITDPKRAFQALQYCLYEMERRYALLDQLGVRDIRSYNRRLVEREEKLSHGPLPYLVIVIDEFADLMATTGKELEATLARLAAMARAVGIHIVLATQRPSIDVITGLIKANIPSRIAFMVAGKFDSRIIIDAVGAEKLLGRGDMLFVPAWDSNPLRIQGALVSEEEVERITEKVRELGEPDYIDEDILFDDEETELVLEPGGNDPMMDQALEIVAAAGKASASYLQRKLKIGYNRAARLVEEMEQRGIVGPANGSKPREILHLPSRDKS